MWLDNLKELKKDRQMSSKQIAERSNLPERTVTRVFSGCTANPYIDTLDRIATALGCSLGDILAGTKAVVGDSNLSTLQESIDIVNAEKETLMAERDMVIAENTILKEKVNTLSNENELLKMQIMYKDQIIAIHDYYNKLKPKDTKGES